MADAKEHRELHYLNTREQREIGIYEYPAETPKGSVIFPAAMAVRQHFYRHYAHYLAEQGYTVYSFDYSGIGISAPDKLRGSKITMDVWIEDTQTVLDWVYQRDKPERYFYITHSLGGQFFGLLENTGRVDAMISITSQNGYWRFYKRKYGYFFFWYLLTPLLYHVLGYFPGSKVGFGVDVPKKVMQQWKRWCTSENYFFDDDDLETTHRFDNYQGPILTLSFTDDPWATQEAVDDLVHHYSSAEIEHRHIHPREANLDAIGHLGFFKPKSQDLWRETVQWLEQQE